MKITRNNLRGTSCISFPVGDKSFDAWMKECEKPGATLYGAAEKVLKRRGGKVQVKNSPCDCEDGEP